MSINLIMGCMFSGKTSKLINVAKNCKLIGKKVLLINFIGDTRYSSSNFITTHDGTSIECKTCHCDIIDVLNFMDYTDADVVCINEGQFFKNLVNFCKKSCELEKDVYVCGLESDYRMEPFGEITKLIPYCDNVEKTKAICMGCKNGTLASFTKRTGISQNVIEIGSTDMYMPVCRKCYNN
jgi:thymidine kinase